MHTTTHTIPATTVEHLKTTVTATIAGQPVNPTSDQVELCLIPIGTNPTAEDWQAGTWETATPPAGPAEYLARLLYNGASPPGEYALWLRLVHAPETIVRQAGRVRLT